MKKELKELLMVLGKLLKVVIRLVRFTAGYPILYLGLLVLPPPKKKIAQAVKASKLSKTKLDYIMTPEPSEQSKESKATRKKG